MIIIQKVKYIMKLYSLSIMYLKFYFYWFSTSSIILLIKNKVSAEYITIEQQIMLNNHLIYFFIGFMLFISLISCGIPSSESLLLFCDTDYCLFYRLFCYFGLRSSGLLSPYFVPYLLINVIPKFLLFFRYYY